LGKIKVFIAFIQLLFMSDAFLLRRILKTLKNIERDIREISNRFDKA
jgi:hypothetical protein